MSERGVFAVDRGIFNDPDFANEPFTEREAFMWLVSEAAWKDHKKRADGKIVDLKRGQLCHSVRFMAEAWQWSKSRVDRFLGRLQNRDMIRRDAGTRTPVISICKYDAFQRVSLPDRDNSGTDAGTSVGQQRDKLEDREFRELSSSLRSEELARNPKPDLKAEFESSFWPLYPHKVGKPEGLKAFIKARQRADLGTIITGLRAYVAKTDDRPWCNPSTWLNQDRWNDQPAVVPRGRAPPDGPDLADLFKRNADEMRGYDDGRTIEGSYERGNLDGAFQAVPRIAAS